jgi:hypothetical protein
MRITRKTDGRRDWTSTGCAWQALRPMSILARAYREDGFPTRLPLPAGPPSSDSEETPS